MNAWWKIGFILACITFIAMTAWHVKDMFDKADQAIALKQQQADYEARMADINKKAVQTETELAADRLQTSSFTQKWSENHAKQKSPDCPLPADSLGLLRQATVPHNHAR